jgi:nucleoside-diphosphate-sugar epimerase
VNVLGTANVLEAAHLTGVTRIVYASTGGVYSRNSNRPIPEEHPFETSSLYNASKLAAEQIGLQYSQLSKTEFVVLRYGVVYGPSFSSQGSIYGRIIQELITKPANGLPVIIQRTAPFMKGNDLVYVKDIAKATAAAVKTMKLKDRVFNIGSGTLTDLEDLAASLRQLLPNADIMIEEPNGPLVNEPFLFPMDISRAKEQLGFTPVYGTFEALQDYLASL